MADQLHIIMAGYDDPAVARADYGQLRKLGHSPSITIDGMVLVARDPDGQIAVKESGDDDDRVFGGTMFGVVGGFAIGLFFPPLLLASTVVGAALGAMGGELIKHHHAKGVAEDLESVLPAGGSAVIVVLAPRFAERAKESLTHADRSRMTEADASHADALKKALQEAADKSKDA